MVVCMVDRVRVTENSREKMGRLTDNLDLFIVLEELALVVEVFALHRHILEKVFSFAIKMVVQKQQVKDA